MDGEDLSGLAKAGCEAAQRLGSMGTAIIRWPLFGALGGSVLLLVATACSPISGASHDGSASDAGGKTASEAGGSAGTSASASGGTSPAPEINIDGLSSGGADSVMTCGLPDCDADGFTVAEGDCADNDPNVNPGAYDVPGNGIDEDCSGAFDDTVTACDQLITDIADAAPENAARALGLCHFTSPTESGWGVLSARYVLADGIVGGDPIGHGLLEDFGPNVAPLEGQRILVLSSGTARRPLDPGFVSPMGALHGPIDPDIGEPVGEPSGLPPGYPVGSPACPEVVFGPDELAFDAAALEITLRVPTNARSFSFKFNFYTYEFPEFICSEYNDFFFVLQEPAPPDALLGNISFDSQNNPVSVNNGFLEVCDPVIGATMPGGKLFPCALGTDQLEQTGFFDEIDNGGPRAATGWLETVSPVEPGSEVVLRFVVHDMGDPILDSTVLLDRFEFSTEPAMGPITAPVPIVK